MTLQFHVDFLEDARYAMAFAVASGQVANNAFYLLDGDQKVALGYVVDEGEEPADEEAVSAVPVDDWLFGWHNHTDNSWYVLEPASASEGSCLTILALHPECDCWRPRAVFNFGDGLETEAFLDECDGIWMDTDGRWLYPVVTADEPVPLDDCILPEAVNDR